MATDLGYFLQAFNPTEFIKGYEQGEKFVTSQDLAKAQARTAGSVADIAGVRAEEFQAPEFRETRRLETLLTGKQATLGGQLIGADIEAARREEPTLVTAGQIRIQNVLGQEQKIRAGQRAEQPFFEPRVSYAQGVAGQLEKQMPELLRAAGLQIEDSVLNRGETHGTATDKVAARGARDLANSVAARPENQGKDPVDVLEISYGEAPDATQKALLRLQRNQLLDAQMAKAAGAFEAQLADPARANAPTTAGLEQVINTYMRKRPGLEVRYDQQSNSVVFVDPKATDPKNAAVASFAATPAGAYGFARNEAGLISRPGAIRPGQARGAPTQENQIKALLDAAAGVQKAATLAGKPAVSGGGAAQGGAPAAGGGNVTFSGGRSEEQVRGGFAAELINMGSRMQRGAPLNQILAEATRLRTENENALSRLSAESAPERNPTAAREQEGMLEQINRLKKIENTVLSALRGANIATQERQARSPEELRRVYGGSAAGAIQQ